MTWSKVLTIVAAILGPLMRLISPKIRDGLKSLLDQLWVKAKATENAFDDIFVKFLFELLGVTKPQDMD